MPPAPISLNAPVAEPPFETTPEIVAPLGLGAVDVSADDGWVASAMTGDFDDPPQPAARRATSV